MALVFRPIHKIHWATADQCRIKNPVTPAKAGAHMWTAPCLQDAAHGFDRIACSHMSGLLDTVARDRWPRWFPRRELRTWRRYWKTVGHRGLSRVWDRSIAPSAPSRASLGVSGM